MSTNRVFAGNEKNNIARAVPEGTKAGDYVLLGDFATSYRAAVAITDRAGATRTEELAGGYEITYPSGGASLPEGYASLYTDGTYDLPVLDAPEPPVQDRPVYYITSSGHTLEGKLTADVARSGADPTDVFSAVLFGHLNYPVDNYSAKAGIAPVRIGN